MAIQTTTLPTAAGWAVNDAIRNAARATGTSFAYLLATAKVESGLDPKEASGTSSARGLFQFIDQTWLTMLKEAGPALGLGRYAQAITANASGRYEVADPSERRVVMARPGFRPRPMRRSDTRSMPGARGPISTAQAASSAG